MSQMFPLLGPLVGSGRRSGGGGGGSGYTDEAAQDAVGGILTDTTSVNLTYNDSVPSITADVIFGNTSVTACVGDDSRLSDARAPLAHNHSADEITSGLLSTDRYSAYADLTAESKIGTGSTQVAAGNHSHAPAIAGVEDGFLSGADKAKLDGIEAGATADQTGAEIVAAIDANLGGTTWQSGGGGAHASSHGSGQSDAITIAQSQVTNLTTDLAGKAATSHSHAQSDVTNLTADLAGKAAASHLHDDWYMVYLSSNQSAITGTNSADALFNTAFRAKSGFSISSGIMTLPANATYLVEYYLHAEFTTASTKGEIPCVLQFDGTGSYVDVTGSNSTLAHGGSASTTKYQRNSASGYGEVTVGGADKHVKVRLGPNSASASDVVLLGGMCRMRARKIY